ncbi:unnamed protein product [Rhizophagus irregularis]|nr:unnamed protein product [Rhizophagus irregularis]
MSSNTETENPINWIEEAILKGHIKYYDYNHFSNIKEIGSGNFGKVYRANWKNSDQYLALKSFFNLNKATIKELSHEIDLHRDVDFHHNIIRFYGITKFNSENEIDKSKNYLLVMEYADGGSLRNYLKENFNNLTWENKYDLAYQLACAVSCLHGEAIVHRDLHSGNVLVHQNKIKIADFGLSKRIEESSQKKYLFGIIPYIDPKKFAISNGNPYSLNEKSDIYSVGVLLWEISSGQLPFKDVDYDICLVLRIFKDQREKSVEDTPDEYVKLYTECWDGEPDNRPSINDVVQRLRANLSRSRMEIDNLKPNDNMDLNCIKNSAHGGLSRIIQDLEKINTSENIPTSKKKLVDEIKFIIGC